MALIYFYDSSELDKEQLNQGLSDTDHQWQFVEDKISLENLDPEAEVISVFVTSTVTKEMIEAMPKLKLIACRSTGFNNVDHATAKEKGVTVVNVPTYGEATVAEYVFALLLALTRKLQEVLDTENEQFEQSQLIGQDLSGKTLGVIGAGHIGQHTIRIGNGFAMRVIVYDAFPNEELAKSNNYQYVSLDELLNQSDFVSIHAPYLPETHHLINSEKINLMKPSSIIVNTSRGEIIETNALVEALNDKKIAGAAIDVVEGEALLNHHEETALLRSHNLPDDVLRHSIEISLLKKMPNVIISPHNAFNTVEAVERINNTTSLNIIKFWYGDVPNIVKPPNKKMGKLLVCRHSESEWNATGQWTGITDVHLDEKGFKESAKLGLKVKSLNIPIDIGYCSEQIRTRETIEGILNASQMFDVDIVRSGAINERDYGDYTGKNKWEMKEQLGEEHFNDIRRGWDVEVPNGETLKMVYERVIPFYKNEIMPLLKEGKNVLLVAHGNSIRALMKYIESIQDSDVGNLEMIFGEILIYDVDDNGLSKSKEIQKIETQPPNA
jgi:D-lactate dehydrogenase